MLTVVIDMEPDYGMVSVGREGVDPFFARIPMGSLENVLAVVPDVVAGAELGWSNAPRRPQNVPMVQGELPESPAEPEPAPTKPKAAKPKAKRKSRAKAKKD